MRLGFYFTALPEGWESGRKTRKKKKTLLEKSRNDDYASVSIVKCDFLIIPKLLIWLVVLGMMKTLPSIHCAGFLN